MGDEGGENPVRLLIADDHALVRQGLRGILEREQDIEVVGEAHNGREAVDLCRALGPNLVLMDVRMPEIDGLEATRVIKHECPEGGCSGTVRKASRLTLRLPRGLRLLQLLFYVGPETGEGADVDLVVIGLQPLLALPLCAAAAQDGAEVAGQEAQRHRYYGGASPLERE